MTTRVLVYEDEDVRRYDVFNDDGELIGQDEESKNPEPSETCPTCGRPF